MKRSHRKAGFTLVELLVVIGIIALLISILLPTLASARRSANSVKCLASLKEIGNAFQMYSMENKGMYPAVRDQVNIYTSSGVAAERRWTDMLAKYFNKSAAAFERVDDITKIRRNSVLWGCPEYTKAFEFEGSYADKVYNGYGMQYAPGFPERYDNETNAMRMANPLRKGYLRQSLYARKGAQRLLVADSRYDFVAIPSAAISTTSYTRFDGFNTGQVGLWPWIQAVTTTNDMSIESRHMKPGTPKTAALNQKTINALFCDGHAESITARDAFNAIRNPGQDSTR